MLTTKDGVKYMTVIPQKWQRKIKVNNINVTLPKKAIVIVVMSAFKHWIFLLKNSPNGSL